MTDLHSAIRNAFDYLKSEMDIPSDVWAGAVKARVFAGKAGGDLPSISAEYNDSIVKALIDYFEGGSIVTSKNEYKRAMVEAFGAAFDLGWTDGGRDLPPDENALSWLNARVDAEFGYIEMLFQEAKELKKTEGFDYFSWATARADGYVNSLREAYNSAKLRAMTDKMVTFAGDDGAKSCATCQKLKGKRHKISWFVKRNYVPPHGSGLDCAKGGLCQHGLVDDQGVWVTA